MKREIFIIEGLHCASCVNRLQTKLLAEEGISEASVNLASRKAHITYDPDIIGRKGIIKAVEAAGYKAVDVVDYMEGNEERSKKINFILSAIFSLPLLLITMAEHFGLYKMFSSDLNNAVFQILLSTPVLFFGREFYLNGIKSLIRSKTATMDTLVALGTGVAYLYSLFVSIMIFLNKEGYDSMHLYFETSAVLITFILLGRYLESKARGKTSEAIKKLIQLSPKEATVIRDGKENIIPISEVITGDLVIVKSGQQIPVDGVITEGYSSVDESMITGESIPVEKKPGDNVIAGTINKMGALKILARSVGQNTMLAQIIRLVDEAQSSKAPIQKLADKISSVFVPTVVFIALLSFFIWKFFGFDTYFAIKTMISVLIIACPCSLGLAAPTAVIVGTGMGAERGILFKNAESIEKLSQIDTIALDKTGTLTSGKPNIIEIKTEMDRHLFLKYVASLERVSMHPLSEPILRAYNSNDFFEVKNFQTHPGKGISGEIDGKFIYIGSSSFLTENGFELNEAVDEAYSYIFIGIEYEYRKKYIGYVSFFDNIKDDALNFVTKIKELGIKVVMITGDNEKVAEKVAKTLNITRYWSKVLPNEKQNIITELKNVGHRVAMIGDGINDAPALASAHVGIAFSSGTDIAVEAGDLVITNQNLMTIYRALQLSRIIINKIKQNFFWAFIYNSLGIPISAGILYPFFGVLLNPMFAGMAMALSSVSVVTNSLLMKKNYI